MSSYSICAIDLDLADAFVRLAPQFSGGTRPAVLWHFMRGRPPQLLVRRLARGEQPLNLQIAAARREYGGRPHRYQGLTHQSRLSMWNVWRIRCATGARMTPATRMTAKPQ